MPPAPVTVAGIVELPQANSLFQTVGAPAGAQPAAPPDNVVPMPAAQWHQLFDPLAAARQDLVSTQIHVQRSHQLPADPAGLTKVQAAAHNLDARSAGAARVGDNLGAALDAARGDAAYARVLFLFLGLPGVVLAALLTATVTSAGVARRRAEQALLRVRGAGTRQLLVLTAAEALVIGIGGAGLGLGAAALVNTATTGTPRFAPTGRRGLAGRRRGGGRFSSRSPLCCCRHTVGCARTVSRPPEIGPRHRWRRSGRGWNWMRRCWPPRASYSPRRPVPGINWCLRPRVCRRSRCPTGRSPDPHCCGWVQRWRRGGWPICCWAAAEG